MTLPLVNEAEVELTAIRAPGPAGNTVNKATRPCALRADVAQPLAAT